ncbi:Serine/threonine-protein kinase pkn1 [Marinobacter sp. THAF39]|nr:Serine/threonine-protein kinase pkn1 [Marinobacter sp. THAF197a]QFT50003.1 Serine/threonine-protein kinase pkn1 [Marinobacter sp. THAF39]
MRISRHFREFLPVALITSTTLAGCSEYSDSKEDDMVHRQMEAMVFVEGGAFMMGNPGGWAMGADTIPAHEVVLDDFHIQKYEVTQADFETFLAASGHNIEANRYEVNKERYPERFSDDLPAAVSWLDAKAFCRWLGEQSGRLVDLPTEAQWEYAARSRGQTVRHATNNGAIEPGRNINRANDPAISSHKSNHRIPEPPGQYPPNPLGLYDMSGNVSEWVNDYYQPDYYQYSEIVNPKGPETGEHSSFFDAPRRVMRGANFEGPIINSSAVVRLKAAQSAAPLYGGFRCADN